MRVTKTVREYIEKQVTTKLEPKYAEEKKMAEYQMKVLKTVCDEAAEAAERAYNEVFDRIVPQTDFLKDGRNPSYGFGKLDFHTTRFLSIKDATTLESVHSWHIRMGKEIKEKVDSIVVSLELGGTKADLDRMLAELDG